MCEVIHLKTQQATRFSRNENSNVLALGIVTFPTPLYLYLPSDIGQFEGEHGAIRVSAYSSASWQMPTTVASEEIVATIYGFHACFLFHHISITLLLILDKYILFIRPLHALPLISTSTVALWNREASRLSTWLHTPKKPAFFLLF